MKATAFDRRTPAIEMRRHRRAWRVDETHFEVLSRSGDQRYGVTLEPSGDLHCTCTAGHYGVPCWHEQRVADRLLREGVPEAILGDATSADPAADLWERL
jgi:hypothetical protein